MEVVVLLFRRTAWPDWFGGILAVLKVPVVKNDPSRQGNIHAELGGNLHHVVAVLEDVWRQRAFFRAKDIGGAAWMVEGRQLDRIIGQSVGRSTASSVGRSVCGWVDRSVGWSVGPSFDR